MNGNPDYWGYSVSQTQYNARRRRYHSRVNFGDGSKREWTDAEDRVVLAHEIPDREIAAKIGRSVCAVQKRRHRLLH
jgi:hypothetical protein